MAKPPGAGGSAALDAMHQLLHIKLKWRLTERELEHIDGGCRNHLRDRQQRQHRRSSWRVRFDDPEH